jgi:hypothetical protein
MPDAFTLIIPVHTNSPGLARMVNDWSQWLARSKRTYEILIVNDGWPVEDFPALTKLANVRVLVHAAPHGFGACLRTALQLSTSPIVSYVLPEYPYTPSSLGPLLERLEKPVEIFGESRRVDVVSGCRTGVAVPAAWRCLGWFYRWGVRVVLGFKPEPLPGWLGLRNHFRSWWLWLLMGVPLVDVTSGLRVFRREVFDLFPIQSDGDFAHAEVMAKLTFTQALIAEEPLPANATAIPATEFREFWQVFRKAKFHNPVKPVVAVDIQNDEVKESQTGETANVVFSTENAVLDREVRSAAADNDATQPPEVSPAVG